MRIPLPEGSVVHVVAGVLSLRLDFGALVLGDVDEPIDELVVLDLDGVLLQVGSAVGRGMVDGVAV